MAAALIVLGLDLALRPAPVRGLVLAPGPVLALIPRSRPDPPPVPPVLVNLLVSGIRPLGNVLLHLVALANGPPVADGPLGRPLLLLAHLPKRPRIMILLNPSEQ